MEGLGSMGHLGGRGGSESRVELGPIKGGVVLEHAEDRMQQLAHDRHQSHHLAFAAGLQMQIKGVQMRSEKRGGSEKNRLTSPPTAKTKTKTHPYLPQSAC